MMKKTLNWLYDYPNLQIYQYEEGFKFSLDSLLLAEFADIKKSDHNIIDLCTGNAVIPIVLVYKYQKHIYGVEIQADVFQLAQESILQNHMNENITLICDNISHLDNYFPGNNFDVVLCNPPYFKYHPTSYVNDSTIKKIARHEIAITLPEIMKIASFLLKDKGRFYFVHVPSRIEEVLVYAHEYGLAAKEIQIIQSKSDRKPKIVLFTFVKKGKFGAKVYAPKVVDGLNSYQNLFKVR